MIPVAPQGFGSEWVEHVMNMTVQGLYPRLFVNVPEPCWYFIGEGVTLWRESDGHSPVEPRGRSPHMLYRSVPGD
jgi:hypothetical protein